jgi:hypothetical protein
MLHPLVRYHTYRNDRARVSGVDREDVKEARGPEFSRAGTGYGEEELKGIAKGK